MTGASRPEAASQIEYYARALRAPRISDAFCRLGDQARDAGWSHEEYLAAVLSKEVSEREASGASLRIKPPGSPDTRRSRTSTSTINLLPTET